MSSDHVPGLLVTTAPWGGQRPPSPSLVNGAATSNGH
jgi:hypothetical protein